MTDGEHVLAIALWVKDAISGDWVPWDGRPPSGSVDHGALTGLADDDHAQYLLVNGSRNSTGNQKFAAGLQVQPSQTLKFRNPADTFQSTFVAGAQVVDLPYTLPVTAPALGSFLQSTPSGVLSWVPIATAVRNIEFQTSGGLVASTGSPKGAPIIIDFNSPATISEVEMIVGGNATVSITSLIGDIHKILAANKNTDGVGTTIYTTQANRPTIPVGERWVAATTPDVTNVAAGDALAFFIDQAGNVPDVGFKIKAVV